MALVVAGAGYAVACGAPVECGDGTSMVGDECIVADDDGAVPPGTGDSVVGDADAGTHVRVNDACNVRSRTGAKMVERQMPDGRRYCIDATEVTVAQYEEFVHTEPETETQATVCLGNLEFVDPLCLMFAQSPTDSPDNPVGCVDWCDATAYCAWAGKRLCEVAAPDVDPDASGARAVEEFFGADPVANDEWLNACSATGSRAFAYGDNYDRDRCPTGAVHASGCADSDAELFGMSGNSAEWIAPCIDAVAGCATRSRFAALPNRELVDDDELEDGICTSVEVYLREDTDERIGFRCCGDIVD